MEDEIWEHVKDYWGFYMINNYGVVMKTDGTIVTQFFNSHGYYAVSLTKDKKKKQHTVHVLMGINFLGYIPRVNNMVVDHIDNDKTNNYLPNLQIITTRENTSKDRFRKNYTSKYIGVYWHKHAKKWCSSFGIGKKTICLGYFHNEIDAHNAYLEKLKEIENG